MEMFRQPFQKRLVRVFDTCHSIHVICTSGVSIRDRVFGVRVGRGSPGHGDSDDAAEQGVQARGKVVRVERRPAVAYRPVQLVFVVLRETGTDKKHKGK